MPAKKPTKSKGISKKAVHSLHYSVAVLVLLVLGIGSALILSQQSQDSRGSAKECRTENVGGTNTWVCISKKTPGTPVRSLPQGASTVGQNPPPSKSSAANAVQQAAQTVAAWLGVTTNGQTSDKLAKTPGTPYRSLDSSTSTAGMTQAQIDAKNVADAQAKKVADGTSSAPTSGGTGSGSGGTGGSSGTTNAALSPEVLYTQQIFRELIGRVPPTTDKGFNTLVGEVRRNNCIAVVEAFNYNDEFKARKQNYSNYQYARMMHRALVARTFAPDDASNGWVKALDNGMSREQLAASIWSFDEPKAACAARKLTTN